MKLFVGNLFQKTLVGIYATIKLSHNHFALWKSEKCLKYKHFKISQVVYAVKQLFSFKKYGFFVQLKTEISNFYFCPKLKLTITISRKKFQFSKFEKSLPFY